MKPFNSKTITYCEFSEKYEVNFKAKSKLEGLLGIGGFGRVYLGYDKIKNQQVAIKRADTDKELLKEVEMGKKIPPNSNIARYLDGFRVDSASEDYDLAIMQYYPTGNLDELFFHRKDSVEIIETQLDSILRGILEGLTYLHEGFKNEDGQTLHCIHRDLKPANILIAEYKGKFTPLITDFGVSKTLQNEEQHSQGISTTVGTISYKAPEQFTVGAKYNASLDLWAFGVMLFKILKGGRLPFFYEGEHGADSSRREVENQILNKDLEEVFRQVSDQHPKYQKMLRMCLVRDYKSRVQSARSLINLLDETEEVIGDDGPTDLMEPRILSFDLSPETVQRGNEIKISWRVACKPQKITLHSKELNYQEDISENKGERSIKLEKAATFTLEVHYTVLKEAKVISQKRTVSLPDKPARNISPSTVLFAVVILSALIVTVVFFSPKRGETVEDISTEDEVAEAIIDEPALEEIVADSTVMSLDSNRETNNSYVPDTKSTKQQSNTSVSKETAKSYYGTLNNLVVQSQPYLGEKYTYTGSIKNGKPHGFGKATLVSGDATYEGDFEDGIFVYGAANCVKCGYLHQGRFYGFSAEGLGTRTSSKSGKSIDANFTSNMAFEGKIKYSDGSTYNGEFEDLSPSGKGEMKYKDGGYYKGDFLKGLPHGKGKFVDANGKVMEGKFENNQYIGQN